MIKPDEGGSKNTDGDTEPVSRGRVTYLPKPGSTAVRTAQGRATKRSSRWRRAPSAPPPRSHGALCTPPPPTTTSHGGSPIACPSLSHCAVSYLRRQYRKMVKCVSTAVTLLPELAKAPPQPPPTALTLTSYLPGKPLHCSASSVERGTHSPHLTGLL